MSNNTCPCCGHSWKNVRKTAAKVIKLMSEGGKSLKTACNHYGRGYGHSGVNYNYNWKSISRHLTREPIMVLRGGEK